MNDHDLTPILTISHRGSMAPLNSQSRFSMGLARAGPGWGAGIPTLKYRDNFGWEM